MFVIAASIIGIGVLVLNWTSDGWYLYYTWKGPSLAPIRWERLGLFFTEDIEGLAGWLIPILGFGFYLAIRRRRIDLLPLLLFPCALAVSMAPRLSPGGYANAFVTIAAFIGIGTGLSLGLMRDCFGARSRYNQIALALVLVHFIFRCYDPRTTWRTAAISKQRWPPLTRFVLFRNPCFVPTIRTCFILPGIRCTRVFTWSMSCGFTGSPAPSC